MRRVLLSAIALAFSATTLLAQGVQTGSIRGTVRDADGRAVAGATIRAISASGHGTRNAVTDTEGVFTLAALPAGTYDLTVSASKFDAVKRSIGVPVGSTIEEHVVLQVAGVRETVQVTSETPAPIADPSVGLNLAHDDVEKLATPRTPQGIAQLAPGLTENAPQNNNQVVINGAFAFDNVFMINGVDINDNLFAQPQNLFVEDAIEQTQVLTSGISAEFGRFTGGVVNAITKSGGNAVHGSGRINFTNPSWTTATPFEITRGTDSAAHPNSLQKTYEGTFGGPIVRDRLWFFGSGRAAVLDSVRTLAQTALTVPTRETNKRGEIKLTAKLRDTQTLQGGFFTSPRTQTNTSGAQNLVITPDSEANPVTRNWYAYGNYHAILGAQTLFEGQYSMRRWKVENSGGNSTDLLKSPFLSATQCGCLYNAPYFDSSDPEERNNAQGTANLTRFWTGQGRHETKAGYEFFRSQRAGGGSQSPTSYVFNSDFATGTGGLPALDANGHVIPVFTPGVSSVDYYPAARGAVLNVDTQSVFLQDHWKPNSHWSADLGARFEHVKAVSTGNIVGVNNHRIVPRLAASYDVAGNGKHVVHATYGWYSGRYNESQIGANSPVVNPPQITTLYRGPAGQGVNFAPGFAIANYPVDSSSAAKVPTANVFMDPDLRSPVVREFTASYGVSLFRGRGYVEGAYIHRRAVDLIEDFQTRSGGATAVVVSGVNAGTFTNVVYRNSDDAYRVFDAVELQSQFRMSSRWTLAGHYTVQLRNEGNYEGENASQPGKPSFIGNYPEAFNATRNFPDGTLQSFQRHRARVWSIYDVPMQRFGTLSVSGIWRIDSALPYSLRTVSPSLTSTQANLIAAAGYPDAPTTAGPSNYYVFFGARGSERFNGFALVDTSMNYDVPVHGKVRPWVKLDVFNLLDNKKLIAWNVTVRADAASPKDNLGLATGYTKGPTFGTATGNTISLSGLTVNAFPVAFNGALPGGRTVRIAIGVRF